MEENKELLYTILRHTCTDSSEFDEKTVFSTANIFMSIASKINKKSSAFQNLKAVFLHSCNLTNEALDALSKLGDTICSRQLLDVKTDLAIKDEDHMGQIAKSHHLAFVIDNLDKLVKKVVNHKTLPIILCRPIVDSVERLQNHRKTIEESHSNFEAEFFFLTHLAIQKKNTLSCR